MFRHRFLLLHDTASRLCDRISTLIPKDSVEIIPAAVTTDSHFDERLPALEVFKATLAETSDMACHWEIIAQDRERVPLCVNYGTSGSGKTTLLFHILHDFEIKQRRG
eukprot:PhF_6_TR42429/c0_g1_i2/m.63994